MRGTPLWANTLAKLGVMAEGRYPLWDPFSPVMAKPVSHAESRNAGHAVTPVMGEARYPATRGTSVTALQTPRRTLNRFHEFRILAKRIVGR